MASNVSEMIEVLFDMIDEAKNVPLSGDKCMIERDRALDLIDEIRNAFPMELEEARRIMANRTEYVNSAKREADSIRQAAEDKARQLLAEDTIVLQARQRANEMLHQAEERSRELTFQSEERSRELKRAANEYCEDALRRTEEAVAEAYEEIKQSRARFCAAAGAMTGGSAAAAPNPGSRPIYDAAADED